MTTSHHSHHSPGASAWASPRPARGSAGQAESSSAAVADSDYAAHAASAFDSDTGLQHADSSSGELRVVDVRDILFSQDSIGPHFRDPAKPSLQKFIDQLKAGEVSKDDLPPANVVEKEDGTLVALDNRRPYALQKGLAGKRQQDVTVNVMQKEMVADELERKSTNKCDGKEIRVRDGHAKSEHRIGPRGGEYFHEEDSRKVLVSKATRPQIAENVQKLPQACRQQVLRKLEDRGLLDEEDARQAQMNPGFLKEKIQAEIGEGYRLGQDGRLRDPVTGRFMSCEQVTAVRHQREAEAAGKDEQRQQAAQHAGQEHRRAQEEQQRQQAAAEQERRRAQEERQALSSSRGCSGGGYPSGSSSAGGSSGAREIHTGPRGGQYYINSNGNKSYVRQ